MTTLTAAADVLRCFSGERREITVTEVTTLLGIPKSTSSRLLRAMQAAGFLETVGRSKRYRPSVLLHSVGRIYRNGSSLIEKASEVVARIVAETGHTGYVSMREGRDIIAVVDHPGTHTLRVVSSVGRRLHAFASATGRTLLARLSDAEIRALYPAPLEPPSPTCPQNLEELLVRVARTRREGFAESNDESNRGVGAIAVAVGDPETGEAVSLCIAFPAATITDAERQRIIEALKAGAAKIAKLTADHQFHPAPVR